MSMRRMFHMDVVRRRLSVNKLYQHSYRKHASIGCIMYYLHLTKINILRTIHFDVLKLFGICEIVGPMQINSVQIS